MRGRNMGCACSYSVIICFCLLILADQTSSLLQPKCPFNALYHVGDGVADNGNAIRTFPNGRLLPAARLPYGKTFPGRATGRWTDGRLIIDYAAIVLGFTQIKPYLERNGNSSNGVIFAVDGSPILNRSFYASKRVKIPSYVAPLNVQLNWFNQSLRSTCSTPTDCKNRLQKSLFLMGDIEGNDIRYPLLQGRSIQDIQTNYVPLAIETLINGTREVIKAGANRIILPENVPLGCYPSILSAFPSTNDPLAYDDIGCLKSVNNLVMFRNNMLQTALISLRLEYPNVTILPAPYFIVVQSLLRQAALLDFDNTLLKSCCGIGGQYNYNSTRFCGSSLVPVCPNPNKYIHWDGVHLTQEANFKISKILVAGLLPALGCL